MLYQMLVADSYEKKKMMARQSLSSPLAFVSPSELLESLTFKLSPSLVIEVAKAFELHFDLAYQLLDNLRYLRSKSVDSRETKRVAYLRKIAEFISDRKIANPGYGRILLSKGNLVLRGFEEEYIVLERLLNDRGVAFSTDYLSPELKRQPIEEFTTISEEIVEVLHRVFDLITAGVDPAKISLVAPDQNYRTMVENIASLFKLPLKHRAIYLSDLPFFNRFLHAVKDGGDTRELLLLDDSDDAVTTEAKNLLSTVLEETDLAAMDGKLLLEYLRYTAAKCLITAEDRGLSLSSQLPCDKDHFVFVMGFNTDLISPAKDLDYLGDEEKKSFTFDLTSSGRNQARERLFIKHLTSYKSVTLTYSANPGNGDVRPLFAGNTAEFFLVAGERSSNRYSHTADRFLRTAADQNYRRYHLATPFGRYLDSLDLGEITAYDNRAKFAHPVPLKRCSYSSISQYFECPFKYFLANVAGLGEREDSFSLKLGTILHRYMERFNRLGTFEPELDEAEFNFDPKEEFYYHQIFHAIKTSLPFIVSYHQSFHGLSADPELSFTYEIDKETELVGRYDLVLSDADSYVIFDYKSGGERFDHQAALHGFSTQLPLYTLAAASLFSTKVCLGAFIAPLVELDGDNKKLCLRGYTAHRHELEKHCPDHQAVINEAKSGYELTEKENETLLETTLERLKKAVLGIKSGEFQIAPKTYKSYSSCRFCSFHDICAVVPEQVENLVDAVEEEVEDE